MGGAFGRVTWISAIVAVLLAFIMLAPPGLQLGGKSVNVSPVDNAAAANGNRIITIGQVDYGGGMATLNPFVYTQSEEYQTIWPVYSTMLMYDMNNNIIGDLATSWSVSPDGKTWTFELANNAYFCDPLAPTVKDPARLVTAADVIWTYWEVCNDTGNHLNSYFNNSVEGVIKSMRQGANQFEFIMVTKFPYAPLENALTIIPIVPKYIWGSLLHPLTYGNTPMVGSGPFYSTMTRVPSTSADLLRSPIWFQEVNRGWQLHVDKLTWKTELNPATAWNELTTSTPVIDIYMTVAQSQYLNNIVNTTTPWVKGFNKATGFVFEYQLNQMSNTERYWLEKAGKVQNAGSNNQLMLDPTVKLALAMCLDRETFAQRTLLGLGYATDSIIAKVNPWHHSPTNPVAFNPTGARQLLMNAGWAYDASGNPATSSTCPLYKKGLVNQTVYHPLSFKLLTLTPETYWDTGSRLIAEWASQAGILYTRSLVSTNQANGAWYKADYDAWLWDWWFSPYSDPSTDILSVHTTGNIGSWSGSYWSNVTYDALYNRSISTIDPASRRVITDQMQELLYDDHAAMYPAEREELYAVNYKVWDKDSYGNWDNYIQLMPDWATPYLYMQLSPVDNLAPNVTIGVTDGIVNKAISFFGSANDASTLKYQWYWGDGTNTGWVTTASQKHTYTKDGVYTVYFAAQEQGSADGFISWKSGKVTVVDSANTAPSNPQIAMSPTTGINSGTIVTFTGSATDTDQLYFSWNFGDTFGGVGPTVTHQFKTPGTYTVVMNVTDNHPGTGRPAQKTQVVSVAANGPPTISMPSSAVVNFKQSYTYTATASDPDGDALRYTWYWGDGSKSVTTVPTTTHTYAQKNPGYKLYVHADDLTTLSGHNVTALEVVTVVGTSTPPVITAFTVNNLTTGISAYAGQNLWFTGTAKDPAGDSMTFRFKFGDGVWYNVTNPETGNNVLVTFSVAHPYSTAGTKTAYLYVYDGQDTATSPSRIITITVNSPPQVTPLTDKTGTVGVAISVSGAAYDPDGDALRYTWDFGDSTPKVVAKSTTHTYTEAKIFNYTLYVDDLKPIPGHNVSSTAKATISAVLPTEGLLRVTSNPAVPSMIYIDGNWASPWGLNWVKLSPGSHVLSFSDVPGYITPGDATVTIVAGQTTNYEAQFVPCGSFRVITSPAVPSTIYVNGIPRNDWGFWIDAPAGTYTVSFGAVKDYATPAPQTVTVTSGGYTEVTGTFVSSPGSPGPDPATYGMLRLTTSPAVPSMVYIDGNWACPWGLNWVKLSLGSHTLTYSDVPGFITPAPRTITITAGQTTEVVETFTGTGSLRVITNPAVPSTIYVNGIPRNDWGLWADVPAGTYTVSFGDVAGYNTPAPQTVTLTTGGYQEVTGTFTPK